MSIRPKHLSWLSIASLSLIACLDSHAATVFGTIFTNPGQIVRIDTNSHQVTPVRAVGAFPDSIIFDSSGRLIYTVFGANQVRRFDPATSSDVVVNGGFSGPLDLALEPGGATVLVSNNTSPRIDRLDLNTGVVTSFLPGVGGGGITYDASGRLFAVLPGMIAELNPQTGAVLQNTPGTLVFDGLTFDPLSGSLFASNGSGGQLFRFDRTNLAAGGQLLATLIGPGGFVDGVVADGTGNLFVAVRNVGDESMSGLFQVNATTGAFLQVASAPFLDDIAPLAGLGAPPGTPAPSATIPIPTLSNTLLAALSVILAGMAVRACGASSSRAKARVRLANRVNVGA
jgi:IPTL-CTERM motif